MSPEISALSEFATSHLRATNERDAPLTLGMMAKHWTAGRVKTRLAASIGDERAAQLHRVFCGHLCEVLAPFPARKQVVFDPPEHLAAAQQAFSQTPPTVGEAADPSAWSVVAQRDGDLGERMLHWFTQCAESARDQASKTGTSDAGETPDAVAMLIGADCPTVSTHGLDRAERHLRRNDLVVGPAIDGGYYLIGMRLSILQHATGLFANIPWSTDQVLKCTLRSAHRRGLSIGLLEPKHDVDTVDDLQRLRQTLRQSDRSDYKALERQIRSIVGDTLPLPDARMGEELEIRFE